MQKVRYPNGRKVWNCASPLIKSWLRVCISSSSNTKNTKIAIIFVLPNQELSGAKSELQGEMVGVCSFYKRGGQPPCNIPARPPSVPTTKPASVFICTF